jgi:DNA-binding NarL/FixJ family response regulator
MIRILLVDDQPSIRRGLQMRLALEPDLLVVGEAAGSINVLTLVQALDPDVVVMDAEMSGMDSISAVERLRETAPHIAVVMLSMHGDKEMRQRALEAGVAAFVEKQAGVEALLRAIRLGLSAGALDI